MVNIDHGKERMEKSTQHTETVKGTFNLKTGWQLLMLIIDLR